MSLLATSTKFFTLPKVVMFRAGTWGGRHHTRADLQQLVANYHRYLSVYTPASSEFHDDRYRCGNVTNLRVDGDNLVGDMEDVPEDVATHVVDGRLSQPSIEYWDTINDPIARNMSGFGFDRRNPPGLIFRGVTLLGSSAPGAKGLPPLPRPVAQQGRRAALFNEPTRRFDCPATRKFFSEDYMNRDQMIQAIKASNPWMGDAFLSALADAQLQQLMADAQSAAATADPPAPDADPAAMPPTGAMGDVGADPNAMPGMPPDASKMYADLAATVANARKIETELQRALNVTLEANRHALKASASFADKSLASTRTDIVAFVDEQSRAGRITPAQKAFHVATGLACVGINDSLPKPSAMFFDIAATKRDASLAAWKATFTEIPIDSRFAASAAFMDQSRSALNPAIDAIRRDMLSRDPDGRQFLSNLDAAAAGINKK